jgi:hypothetical protein
MRYCWGSSSIPELHMQFCPCFSFIYGYGDAMFSWLFFSGNLFIGCVALPVSFIYVYGDAMFCWLCSSVNLFVGCVALPVVIQ